MGSVYKSIIGVTNVNCRPWQWPDCIGVSGRRLQTVIVTKRTRMASLQFLMSRLKMIDKKMMDVANRDPGLKTRLA